MLKISSGDGEIPPRIIASQLGENHVIKMDFEQGAGADCGTGDLSINDEINCGFNASCGSTYETLTINDKTIGADLV